jgi:heme-degrading monooxygenase HmoA
MQGRPYTLALWRVQPGREGEFVQAWRQLAEVFRRLPDPPGEGTLVQSVEDPQRFYSFGWWHRLEDIQAMRADPDAGAALARLAALCTEGQPGAYRVVATASGAAAAGAASSEGP